MKPEVTLFNGKVYVMVPDHVEDIVVLRKAKSFQFSLPTDERRILGQKYAEGSRDLTRDPLDQS